MGDRYFGSEVVERLLPHRAPFRMVDVVTSFETGDAPRVTAFRNISANEPVFAGHFPGLHIWPGAYTIEGLAQSIGLLGALQALTEALQSSGAAEGALDRLVESLEPRRRLVPGFRPDPNEALLDRPPTLGVIADVQVRMLAPVWAGDRLDYDVKRIRLVGTTARFEVLATVADNPVARGTLTAAALAFGV